tara:strand:+ start:11493 stop:14312 length:2820 start_codon:yes stop_codon:yes gene_type:complete
VYDAAGRETAMINPLSDRKTMVFDAAGQNTVRIDQESARTTYVYDAAGRVTQRQYPDGARITWTYDAVSNPLVINSSAGAFTRTYDAVNQVQSVAWPTGKIVTWVYDAIGQRSTRDISTGTTTYTYDGRGNLTSLVNEQSEQTTFTYDAAGRAIRTQLANGTLTSMAYDAAGRETQITHFTSDNTAFSSFADTYNAAGNRIQRVNLDGDVTTWTYDSTAQVLSERYTDSLGTTITTFAYDAVGNQLVENNDSAITTSVYDAANRLQTSAATAGITTYTYDKNGNQTSIEDPASDITTYTWTYENQLAEIESPNGDLVTYTYAPVNRKSDELRLSKETDLEFTSYLWDDQNIILEQDEVGTVDAEYTVMPQAYGNLISQTRDADSSFYHFDPLGSTRELTDASETITDSYLYSVFGKVKSSTGTTVNPYQWVGKEGYYHDPESGLYSLRNRFYSANEGRFKSEDPIGFDAGDVNLYRYVGNNAATVTDLSGLQGHILKPGNMNYYTDRYLKIICECEATRITGRKHTKVRSRIETSKPSGWTIAEICNKSCSERNRGWSGKYTIVEGSVGPFSGKQREKDPTIAGGFVSGLCSGANTIITNAPEAFEEACVETYLICRDFDGMMREISTFEPSINDRYECRSSSAKALESGQLGLGEYYASTLSFGVYTQGKSLYLCSQGEITVDQCTETVGTIALFQAAPGVPKLARNCLRRPSVSSTLLKLPKVQPKTSQAPPQSCRIVVELLDSNGNLIGYVDQVTGQVIRPLPAPKSNLPAVASTSSDLPLIPRANCPRLPLRPRVEIENLANKCRLESPRPRTVAKLTLKGGKEFDGRSGFQGRGEELHPVIESAYNDFVPSTSQSIYHKHCAEANAMSKALYSIEKITGVEITSYSQANAILKGATVETASVRSVNHPKHGLTNDPCSSCRWPLDVFDIKYKFE